MSESTIEDIDPEYDTAVFTNSLPIHLQTGASQRINISNADSILLELTEPVQGKRTHLLTDAGMTIRASHSVGRYFHIHIHSHDATNTVHTSVYTNSVT